MTTDANPYMRVPLDRVRTDALNGVRLARIAWRQREPQAAAVAMGRIVEPSKSESVEECPN